MKIILFVSILICATTSSLMAQSSTDTLTLDSLHHMTQLQDLYQLPGENYQLDHFVAYISLPGIDPIGVYNRGSEFLPNTIENLNSLISGSKLSIQAYALNNEHPESGPVKLARRDYFIR